MFLDSIVRTGAKSSPVLLPGSGQAMGPVKQGKRARRNFLSFVPWSTIVIVMVAFTISSGGAVGVRADASEATESGMPSIPEFSLHGDTQPLVQKGQMIGQYVKEGDVTMSSHEGQPAVSLLKQRATSQGVLTSYYPVTGLSAWELNVEFVWTSAGVDDLHDTHGRFSSKPNSNDMPQSGFNIWWTTKPYQLDNEAIQRAMALAKKPQDSNSSIHGENAYGGGASSIIGGSKPFDGLTLSLDASHAATGNGQDYNHQVHIVGRLAYQPSGNRYRLGRCFHELRTGRRVRLSTRYVDRTLKVIVGRETEFGTWDFEYCIHSAPVDLDPVERYIGFSARNVPQSTREEIKLLAVNFTSLDAAWKPKFEKPSLRSSVEKGYKIINLKEHNQRKNLAEEAAALAGAHALALAEAAAAAESATKAAEASAAEAAAASYKQQHVHSAILTGSSSSTSGGNNRASESEAVVAVSSEMKERVEDTYKKVLVVEKLQIDTHASLHQIKSELEQGRQDSAQKLKELENAQHLAQQEFRATSAAVLSNSGRDVRGAAGSVAASGVGNAHNFEELISNVDLRIQRMQAQQLKMMEAIEQHEREHKQEQEKRDSSSGSGLSIVWIFVLVIVSTALQLLATTVYKSLKKGGGLPLTPKRYHAF